MPGNPSNFHILFGDPLIHKKVPTRRWTIGVARDHAITEMRSHLADSFPDAMMPQMPLAKDVKIFRGNRIFFFYFSYLNNLTEQSEADQPTTLIRNLRPSQNSDCMALVPPPANISTGFGALLTKLNNDIEQLKHEYDRKLSKFEQKQLEYEQKQLEYEQKQLEHEQALVDLRVQQADTLSWMVIGVRPSSLIIFGDDNVRSQDEGILDRIMLRNLLDKAQKVVAGACGLEPGSSWNWRDQFTGIGPESDRLVKATSLLEGSSLNNSTIHRLCASRCALLILSERSEIRREGDRSAHEESINMQRYTVAIERQSQSDPERSQALKLLLEIVKGYKLAE